MTNCHQLKMTAEDGKERLTDCATAETPPPPRPIRPQPQSRAHQLWLAKVGYERMPELADPSLSLDRARETYRKQGCSDKGMAQAHDRPGDPQTS